MDFDATQAINLSDFEEDTEDETGNKNPLGYLKVFSNRGFAEKVFPVYEGDNYIGRDEKNEITVPVKSLSKQHACIEVQGDTHLIHDLASRNKSRKGKLFLKPNVRYNIQHEEKFILADMCCQYYFASLYKNPNDNNSGSDTDSELMLEGVDSDPSLLVPEKSKDHDVSENSDDLDVSDCIQPTQAVPADISPQKNKTLNLKTPAHPKAGGVLAAESDDEMNVKKDAADVSRVEDSGSDTDVDVYAADTEDFTVASDDLAVAPTQACLSHEAPTQPTKGTKKTLTFDPDSDSESEGADDEAGKSLFLAETQAFLGGAGSDQDEDADHEAGKSLFLAETQAYPGGPVSDQDEDSNDDRGRSLFEAATQAAPGLASDSDADDDDDGDNARGTSLYEAATQALHYSDSDDNTDKRVSIASTVMNESSDGESNTKRPRPSMSPTKIAMLRATKSTPAGKDSLQKSFIFEKPAAKQKLQDISLDQMESESTDLEESFDKQPFTGDGKDETLPCSEDDFVAETQEISDYDEKQRQSDNDQNKSCQEEHSILEKDKIATEADKTGEKPTQTSTPKPRTQQGKEPSKSETTKEKEKGQISTRTNKEGDVVDPTVPYNLQRTLSEKSKDSESVDDASVSVAPTVPYNLSRELTTSSSGSREDTPREETVVSPIEVCKTVRTVGETIGVEGGSGEVEETQAYGDDLGETAMVVDGEQQVGAKPTEQVQGETLAYGMDEDAETLDMEENDGVEKVVKSNSRHNGGGSRTHAVDETQAYGDDGIVQGELDTEQDVKASDKGLPLEGETGSVEETQAYGGDVEANREQPSGSQRQEKGQRTSGKDNQEIGETQAYGIEETMETDPLVGGCVEQDKMLLGSHDRKAGQKEEESGEFETQAYGLEETVVGHLGGNQEPLGAGAMEVEATQPYGLIEGKDPGMGVEEIQAYGLGDDVDIGQLADGGPVDVGETQAYGLSGDGDTDQLSGIGSAEGETQAYGLGADVDTGQLGRIVPAEGGETLAYGGDDGAMETLAYGGDDGALETLAYGGDDGGETQVPDSQEMEPVPEPDKNTAEKDNVFEEQGNKLTEGMATPNMVETDAAPQRRKSGDEGVLKRARSSQNLSDMDKPDRGGILNTLKKKVRFGKKKSSSSGSSIGSSRSSSRSSRSSTGSKDDDAGGEEEEMESVSLLEDAVLEEERPEIQPSPSKRRRIATIERPDLEAVKISGRKESGDKEKGEVDKNDSEKNAHARSDGRKSARQRRNATVKKPNLDLLTTPEKEESLLGGTTDAGATDSPDGPTAMDVEREQTKVDVNNNNKKGKRSTRSKIVDEKEQQVTESVKEETTRKRPARTKAQEQDVEEDAASTRGRRRGRTRAEEDGQISGDSSKDQKDTGNKKSKEKSLVVKVSRLEDEHDLEREEEVSPELTSVSKEDLPGESLPKKGRSTRGRKEKGKNVSAPDSTIAEQMEEDKDPSKTSQRGKNLTEDVQVGNGTPQKGKKRTKVEEVDAPVRKSSRRERLEPEKVEVEDSTGKGARGNKQEKVAKEGVASGGSQKMEETVTSTTTSSTRGTRRRKGVSAERDDGSVKDSQEEELSASRRGRRNVSGSVEEQPVPSTRGKRNRSGAKTTNKDKTVVASMEGESVAAPTHGTRNRSVTRTGNDEKSMAEQSDDKVQLPTGGRRNRTLPSPLDEENSMTDSQESVSSRKGTRNRKDASAERKDTAVTDSPKPKLSIRGRGSNRGAQVPEEHETDVDTTTSTILSRSSRRKDDPSPNDSSGNKSANKKTETKVTKSSKTKKGQKAVDNNEDSVSSTMSLDSVADDGTFVQPTPSKGRRGRRAKAPALKVEDASPDINESSSPVQEETPSVKQGRGKGTKATLGTSEITSTPSRSVARRSIGRATQKSPRSSPTLLEGISPSLRRRSSEPRPKVMFTGVIDKSGEKVVTHLGGILTESVFECTHLVTDKIHLTASQPPHPDSSYCYICLGGASPRVLLLSRLKFRRDLAVRRTVKFLCCLSQGALIVTPAWLEQSKLQQRFLDASEFLLTDKTAEKTHQFKLINSHEQAKEGALLSGWKIHVTPGVKPEPSQMKDIIRSAGGEFLPRVPCSHQDQTVVMSCEEDGAKCLPAVAADIPVVTSEFLLTGLLRQEVDVDSYRLSIKSTGSSSTPTKKPTSKSRSRKR